MINQDQKDFMEANRPHYNTLVQAEYLTNIGHDVKDGLLAIARVFAPAYQANLWCGPCVCDLVKYAYTQYDKWVAEQVVEVPADAPLIQKATFPKHDRPTGEKTGGIGNLQEVCVSSITTQTQHLKVTSKKRRKKK